MAKKSKATMKQAAEREPHHREVGAIKDARERMKKRPWRAEMKTTVGDDGKVNMTAPHSDQGGWSFQMMDAFGTTSPDFMNTEIMRLVNAVCPKEVVPARIDAAVAVVSGVQPVNEVEAMLAIQMATTHALMMQMASWTMRSDMINHMEAAGNLAVKFARTYTAQAEALAKLRKPPEQRVIVEHKHVHVHPGAQAVVGNVTHTGGGVALENGHQPHATDAMRALELATGPAVWGENAERDAVPVPSSEGEMPVPDARRGNGLRRAARHGERQFPARPADAGNGEHEAGATAAARRAGPDRSIGGSEDDAAA